MRVPKKRSYRLTPVQRRYLEFMYFHKRLRKGWGGMKSTLTIRILEERGLAMVTNWRKDGWVASLTKKGRELLCR